MLLCVPQLLVVTSLGVMAWASPSMHWPPCIYDMIARIFPCFQGLLSRIFAAFSPSSSPPPFFNFFLSVSTFWKPFFLASKLLFFLIWIVCRNIRCDQSFIADSVSAFIEGLVLCQFCLFQVFSKFTANLYRLIAASTRLLVEVWKFTFGHSAQDENTDPVTCCLLAIAV